MAKAVRKAAPRDDDETMVRENPEKVEARANTSSVVYVPNDGDPIRTSCHDVDFRANIPVIIPHDRMCNVMLTEKSIGPEGEERSKGHERKIPLVELLRTNQNFEVDGVALQRRRGSARLPTDPDQYRGYALGWIRATNTLKALNQRWEGEEPLREKCGLEMGDLNYLEPFLEARREQLSDANSGEY
jgi:hypothetical protein